MLIFGFMAELPHAGDRHDDANSDVAAGASTKKDGREVKRLAIATDDGIKGLRDWRGPAFRGRLYCNSSARVVDGLSGVGGWTSYLGPAAKSTLDLG